MNDETLLQTISQRWSEPREQLEAARIELQTAREEIKACNLKAWNHHKDTSALKRDLTTAKEAADVARLELCDANEELSLLEPRVSALVGQLEEVKQSFEAEIEDAKGRNAALQTENELLNAALKHSKEENDETRSNLHTVKFELGIANIRAQTATADASAAKQDLIAANTLNTKLSTALDGASTAEYKSQTELLTTQLRARDEDVVTLQGQLRGEKREYESLVRSTKEQVLVSRSVSTDLLHGCLHNDRKRRNIMSTIKLRDHEWILSRVEDLPQEMNPVNEPVRSENPPAIDVADAPMQPTTNSIMEPDQIGNGDPSILSDTSIAEPSDPTNGTAVRRRPIRRGKTCVCTRCYNEGEDCTGGAQCEPCTEAGVKCTYRTCISGGGCLYNTCGCVHPWQKIVDGFYRNVDVDADWKGRKGRKRKRLG